MRNARFLLVRLWPVNTLLLSWIAVQVSVPHILREYGFGAFMFCILMHMSAIVPLYAVIVNGIHELMVRKCNSGFLLEGEFE